MKTDLLLTLLVLNCSFSWAVRGQSSFALRNRVDAPVYDNLGIPLAGVQYRVELWGSATPDSLTPLVDNGANPETLAGRYPAFTVNPIPEPSTWALLALGGTAVCWVARRQRRR
jgi:hypothetical protein